MFFPLFTATGSSPLNLYPTVVFSCLSVCLSRFNHRSLRRTCISSPLLPSSLLLPPSPSHPSISLLASSTRLSFLPSASLVFGPASVKLFFSLFLPDCLFLSCLVYCPSNSLDSNAPSNSLQFVTVGDNPSSVLSPWPVWHWLVKVSPRSSHLTSVGCSWNARPVSHHAGRDDAPTRFENFENFNLLVFLISAYHPSKHHVFPRYAIASPVEAHVGHRPLPFHVREG